MLPNEIRGRRLKVKLKGEDLYMDLGITREEAEKLVDEHMKSCSAILAQEAAENMLRIVKEKIETAAKNGAGGTYVFDESITKCADGSGLENVVCDEVNSQIDRHLMWQLVIRAVKDAGFDVTSVYEKGNLINLHITWYAEGRDDEDICNGVLKIREKFNKKYVCDGCGCAKCYFVATNTFDSCPCPTRCPYPDMVEGAEPSWKLVEEED